MQISLSIVKRQATFMTSDNALLARSHAGATGRVQRFVERLVASAERFAAGSFYPTGVRVGDLLFGLWTQ